MPVAEILTALGSWDLTLKSTTPPDLWDRLDHFGHVAFLPGRLDPAQYGDNLLDVARYVGVVRKRDNSGDDRRTKVIEQGYELAGVGMAMWLGDEDDKGDVYENAVTPASASFATAITALLPASGAVTAGTIHAVPGVYSGRHQYETPRSAIQYVCDTFAASAGEPVSWRVNADGTLDAGRESDLYVTTPTCVISRKSAGKDTSGLESVPGAFGVTRDVEDFTTRVVLLAEGEGESIATGTADIGPGLNPYKNIHGGALKLTRLASESDTTVTNADARAAVVLSQYTSSQDELVVETDNYYIEGSFAVGDYVWVYDPNAGLVDTANEITFRGERLNPIKLQVTEVKWPVTEGYAVAYRATDGTWFDLTDYVVWDGSHTVYVTVGGFARALQGGGEPVGSRPNQDTSVPGVPVLVEPFVGSAYLDSRGFTRARVILAWNAPNNVDGSTILDGDHYEIRYAVDADMLYPSTWAQVSQITWAAMETWAQPFVAPTGRWQTMLVAWGEAAAQLQDLSPGVGYDVQIRAVDKIGNTGAWSSITTFVASEDNIPPSAPAAPSVAASRIAVQVTHQLGKSSGGTFNLESDLDHLEIHVDYEPTFTPSTTTLKGKVRANAGMIQAQIPVVATVQVEETSARYVRVVAVDITGNKSGPSDAASATALLIDDAHISDLTVSKVTAGTISASWVMAGEIKTADTGARARISGAGYELYNAAGTRTLFADAATGDITVQGQLVSGTAGRRLEINPTSTLLPEIRFFANTGANYGYINAISSGTDSNLGVNGGTFDDAGVTVFPRLFLTSGTSELAILRSDTQARRGGFVWAASSGVYVGHNSGGVEGGIFSATAGEGAIGFDDGGANENRMLFGNNGITRHIGKWRDFVSPDSNEGLFTGSVSPTDDASSFALGYGPTMASALLPLTTIRDNIVHSDTITAADTTGFTVSISPAASGPWAVYFWCFRI
ncbi:hypothetical protein [Streptomyces sp. NPDC002994]|uniref:hypothetical protein n=1 Tax=Streptomyces sp. NPDC002994 TaxID=3154441 RepID=UPI0033BCB24F